MNYGSNPNLSVRVARRFTVGTPVVQSLDTQCHLGIVHIFAPWMLRVYDLNLLSRAKPPLTRPSQHRKPKRRDCYALLQLRRDKHA